MEELRKTERLPFVDVAKGILTILVIIYHIPPSMTLNTVNCNSIIGDISYNTRIWFDAFFMPAFFLINGYCSHFNETAKLFAIKTIKTIVIPVITIVMLCKIVFTFGANPLGALGLFKPSGNWFILSFVIARCFVYILKRNIPSRNVIFGIFLVLTLLALCFSDNQLYPNPYYWKQAFAGSLFIWIGYCLKSVVLNNRRLIILSLFYLFSMLFLITNSLHHPVMVIKLSAIGVWEIFPFVLLAVTGTAFVIFVAKNIKDNFISRHLKFIGKYSLIYYMTQWFVMEFTMSKMGGHINVAEKQGALVMFVLVFVLTLFICYLMVRLFTTKYGSYLLGKF